MVIISYIAHSASPAGPTDAPRHIPAPFCRTSIIATNATHGPPPTVRPYNPTPPSPCVPANGGRYTVYRSYTVLFLYRVPRGTRLSTQQIARRHATGIHFRYLTVAVRADAPHRRVRFLTVAVRADAPPPPAAAIATPSRSRFALKAAVGSVLRPVQGDDRGGLSAQRTLHAAL